MRSLCCFYVCISLYSLTLALGVFYCQYLSQDWCQCYLLYYCSIGNCMHDSWISFTATYMCQTQKCAVTLSISTEQAHSCTLHYSANIMIMRNAHYRWKLIHALFMHKDNYYTENIITTRKCRFIYYYRLTSETWSCTHAVSVTHY